jgi:hypothetical protein
MHFSTFFKVSTLVALAAAHGYPKSMAIDGKAFPGSNGAAGNPSQSPIRKLNNDPNDGTPIFDPSSADMSCGVKSSAVSTIATAKPGSKIDIFWQGPTGINWFHDTGPIITYMAACEGSCSSFTPSASTKWFKIAELGEKQPGTPGTWYQKDLNTGAPASVTLPANLASGGYLLRQEIIALQNGQTEGGAEYYPTCVQLNVQGGASSMNPSPTVNFPGAYTKTDPGVFGNFYNPGVVYVVPGGKVASLNGSGASAKAPAPPANAAPAPKPAPPANAAPAPKPATPSSKPAPAAASPAPVAPKKCNKKRRSVNETTYSPRRSHAKRRLAEAVY